jgi:DNA-directed RNA polymerase beta subunit
MNKTPAGNMVIMALLADDGNNQEDSITANQACFDRGLFNTVVYNTYRSESDKNVVDEQHRVTKPTPETTIHMKAANYERVNAEGFVNVNQYIEDSDVLLLRINKIPKNRLEGVTAATKT